MEILWSQEFFENDFFLGFFYLASPTKLAKFSWLFLAIFFFAPTTGHP